MSARCPKCEQPSTWTGSSGPAKGDPPSTTDTYRCNDGHETTVTVTYE